MYTKEQAIEAAKNLREYTKEHGSIIELRYNEVNNAVMQYEYRIDVFERPASTEQFSKLIAQLEEQKLATEELKQKAAEEEAKIVSPEKTLNYLNTFTE